MSAISIETLPIESITEIDNRSSLSLVQEIIS
jgi:hypothetical protein